MSKNANMKIGCVRVTGNRFLSRNAKLLIIRMVKVEVGVQEWSLPVINDLLVPSLLSLEWRGVTGYR